MPGPLADNGASESLDEFHQLVKDLSDALGPSSGIDSADIDPSDLQKLMEQYTSNEVEWQKYAFDDSSRAYTRNLVDYGNGKSNLLILCWSAGRESPIHDHADAHCVMKVLKGTLRETRYNWPEKLPQALEVQQSTVFRKNGVTYMSDTLGLHKISNEDPNQMAVSLHLYTPPNASKYGCKLFNDQTGESMHCMQAGWFSEQGRKAES